MKTLLATIRQDFRLMRWILVPWLGIQLWWILTHQSILDHEPTRIESKFAAITVIAHIGWAALLAFLAFSHPPRDPCAAWRTRPLNPTMVGLAKVSVGFFLLVVVATISYLASEPFGESRAVRSLFPTWLLTLARYSVIFFLLFFIASLCRSVRQLLFTLPVVVVTWIFVPVMFRKSLQAFFDPGATAASLTVVLTSLGFIYLIIAQYHRARNVRHISLAVVWIFLLLGLLPRIFPDYLEPPPVLQPDGETATVTSFEQFDYSFKSSVRDPDSPTTKFRTETRTIPRLRLQIAFDGLDSSSIWNLSYNGPRWNPATIGSDAGGMILNETLLKQLGVPGYELSGTLSDSVSLETNSHAPGGLLSPERNSIRVGLGRIELRQLADIPVKPSLQETYPSGLSLRLALPGAPYGYPIISVKSEMPPLRHPDFVLKWLPTGSNMVGRHRVYRSPLILLIDDANQRAQFLRSPDYSIEELKANFQKPNFRSGLLLPDWDTPLEVLRIRVFEVTKTGHLTLRVRLPNE